MAVIENHHGVLYAMEPIVCERHRHQDGTEGKAIIGSGMISERGLICPCCYRPARYATPDESALLPKGVR